MANLLKGKIVAEEINKRSIELVNELKEKDVIESEEKFIAEASDSKLLEKYHIPAKNDRAMSISS